MGKYFGTDGVRGEANVELTPELAFKLGRFGGYVLSQHETGRPKVFVARDTRISGEMLESALVAGLLSVGIEVYKLGVLATPGVSYLVRTENASAGVMISASHNPALDNGIKFFGGDGFKLDDAREAEIEALLDAAEDTLPRPSAEGLGTLVDYPEGLRKYEKFLVATGVDLGGLKVALDTANGAAAVSARNVFLDLNAILRLSGINQMVLTSMLEWVQHIQSNCKPWLKKVVQPLVLPLMVIVTVSSLLMKMVILLMATRSCTLSVNTCLKKVSWLKIQL